MSTAHDEAMPEDITDAEAFGWDRWADDLIADDPWPVELDDDDTWLDQDETYHDRRDR